MTTNAAAPTSTDLARIERDALAKLNKSLARTDLDDLLVGARRSLLLVDTSASMHALTATGARRIDALRSVVKDLRSAQPVPVAAFGTFHVAGGYTTVAVVNDIPEPGGQTPLADAIRFGAREGATHLVVVTDGEPDDEQDAFAAAAEFKHPVDVFFVGDSFGRGVQFARDLAARTGGTCNVNDMGKPKELAGKIRALLGDGN